MYILEILLGCFQVYFLTGTNFEPFFLSFFLLIIYFQVY